MQRQKQIFENGVEIVHFVGVSQPDYALCGQDLAGDSIDENGKYDTAMVTLDKCDCKDCIRIVEVCKIIKRSEYVKTNSK